MDGKHRMDSDNRGVRFQAACVHSARHAREVNILKQHNLWPATRPQGCHASISTAARAAASSGAATAMPAAPLAGWVGAGAGVGAAASRPDRLGTGMPVTMSAGAVLMLQQGQGGGEEHACVAVLAREDAALQLQRAASSAAADTMNPAQPHGTWHWVTPCTPTWQRRPVQRA